MPYHSKMHDNFQKFGFLNHLDLLTKCRTRNYHTLASLSW